MEPTRIFSLGYVAQLLQCDVSQIRLACDELGIAAATEINDVQHFAAADVRRLRNHFQKGTPMENAKTRRLLAENREMKNFADNAQAANKYLKRIDTLMAKGLSRQRAAMQAGRENPSGQKAFLLVTNRKPARDLLTAKQKTIRR